MEPKPRGEQDDQQSFLHKNKKLTASGGEEDEIRSAGVGKKFSEYNQSRQVLREAMNDVQTQKMLKLCMNFGDFSS